MAMAMLFDAFVLQALIKRHCRSRESADKKAAATQPDRAQTILIAMCVQGTAAFVLMGLDYLIPESFSYPLLPGLIEVPLDWLIRTSAFMFTIWLLTFTSVLFSLRATYDEAHVLALLNLLASMWFWALCLTVDVVLGTTGIEGLIVLATIFGVLTGLDSFVLYGCMDAMDFFQQRSSDRQRELEEKLAICVLIAIVENLSCLLVCSVFGFLGFWVLC